MNNSFVALIDLFHPNVHCHHIFVASSDQDFCEILLQLRPNLDTDTPEKITVIEGQPISNENGQRDQIGAYFTILQNSELFRAEDGRVLASPRREAATPNHGRPNGSSPAQPASRQQQNNNSRNNGNGGRVNAVNGQNRAAGGVPYTGGRVRSGGLPEVDNGGFSDEEDALHSPTTVGGVPVNSGNANHPRTPEEIRASRRARNGPQQQQQQQRPPATDRDEHADGGNRRREVGAGPSRPSPARNQPASNGYSVDSTSSNQRQVHSPVDRPRPVRPGTQPQHRSDAAPQSNSEAVTRIEPRQPRQQPNSPPPPQSGLDDRLNGPINMPSQILWHVDTVRRDGRMVERWRRVDLWISPNPRIQDDVKQKNPCLTYHLTGQCRGANCVKNHSSVTLGPLEVEQLIVFARAMRCNKGKDCFEVDCFKGHMCPKSRGGCGLGQRCKFADDEHFEYNREQLEATEGVPRG